MILLTTINTLLMTMTAVVPGFVVTKVIAKTQPTLRHYGDITAIRILSYSAITTPASK